MYEVKLRLEITDSNKNQCIFAEDAVFLSL